MSGNTGAPLHLEYLDAAQAQPEVIVNANADKVNNFAAGRSSDASDIGGSITVSDGTNTVHDVVEIVFSKASSVTDEGSGIVRVDNSSGGGGSDSSDTASPLEVSDGSTTIHGVTELLIGSGLALTNPGGGTTARLAATGGGGGSSPFNVSPMTHDGAETFDANDHFEGTNGSAVDTAGTRFSGATAWSWLNQGASTAIQNDGSLLMKSDAATSRGSGLIQPVPASTWSIQTKIALLNLAGTFAGPLVYDSVSGKLLAFGNLNGNVFFVQAMSNPTTFSANVFNGGTLNIAPNGLDSVEIFLRLSFDGTTFTWSYSLSGVEGTFRAVTTQALSAFMVNTPTHFGIWSDSAGTGGQSIALIDDFQQTA